MANKKGIDLCYHQVDIDWKMVKAAGIDFIIPRDGWGTACEKNGEKLYVDPKFLEYVEGALAAGVEVPGVYHFIYGINPAEAKENAACAINAVRKAGLPPSTVIWCDLEYDTVDNARDYRGVVLSAEDQKAITQAFCDYCLEQGYPTGVYVNQDYMSRVYGPDFGSKYDLWLADLEGEAAYPCVYRQTGWAGNIAGIKTQVDTDEYYGQYTAGTAKPAGTADKTEQKKEETDVSGKPKSKEYVRAAFGVLDRAEGLEYINRAPYNCGYCHNDKHMSGDCWNINPKATAWSLYLNDPIDKNYTPGKYYYAEGIKASGLPDTTGDGIMNNYCTKTTFKKMLQEKKAPCLLLINGAHMGAYIGEFTRDGKTYNVSEFSPNSYLGGKMRSYVDEYGQRWSCKGGTLLGSWNQCGYLTAFLDYSDWDSAAADTSESTDTQVVDTPAKTSAESGEISDLTLALQIYKGEWGNNPGRQTSITMKYGAEKYAAAQKIVNSIASAMNWYWIEIIIAEDILDGVYGNNPDRQTTITAKYGANAYRIAQNFVNDIARGAYTREELETSHDVANGILCGTYGNGQERKEKIVAEYGETVRSLAQQIVNEVLK